jgi:uncharacterized lipoprotein YddW (UPF0748 family)
VKLGNTLVFYKILFVVKMKSYTQPKLSFTSLLILLSLSFNLTAQYVQNPSYSPKREMRGVWIASVLNIDYPPGPSPDDNFLRETWIRLIDKHKAMGINTLFVQIRPTADAFYSSNLVPWSRYLTGQSGLAPYNNFDPLEFMITTAHDRGLEFHAWLNPYRVSMDGQTASSFAPNHVLNTHPDWCIFFNKRYFMNPGLPQVRAHINEVVAEIITRYQVDGIHFDDYFYPYKNGNEQINDYQTFQQYQSGFSSIEDWRRNNVDLLIADLSKTIKTLKPRIQFGVSPFGIWRNSRRDPEGSDTNGGSSYDENYADVRKWLRADWVDYVVPQIYWTIGYGIADHEKLVKWWAANSAGKNVYVGLGTYRVGTNSSKEQNWSDPNEIPRQIRLSRSLPNIQGTVHFSSKSLLNNNLGVGDSLRLNYYRSPALPPEGRKDNSLLVCDPPEIRAITSEADGRVAIRWQPNTTTLKKKPFQYLVYRFKNGQVDFTNGHNIIGIMPHNTKEYVFYDPKPETTNLYAVSVSDCQNRESLPSDLLTVGIQPLPSPPPPLVSKTKAPRKKVGWFKSFWRRVFGH